MSQARGRESGDFWAGVTCASSLEGEMPPKWAADTEPHTRGWGTRGLPFIWKSSAPTCQGLAAHLQGHNFAAKAAFFFSGMCHFILFFQLFISYWSIANQQFCNSFRWTAKGLSHIYTRVHPPPNSPPIRPPPDVAQSPLRCMAVVLAGDAF